MSLLQKIRKLPERKRKIILWSSIIAISAVLLFFYVRNVQKKLGEFKTEDLKEGLNKLPSFEIPKIDVQELEKILQEATTTP